MVSVSSEPKTRVNGSVLPQYLGRPVILLGEVMKIDPSGTQVQVKASDNLLVLVKLRDPLMENLNGIVEFYGVGEGQKMVCDQYVSFPDEYQAKFDMTLYDEAIKLIHSIGENPWKFD